MLGGSGVESSYKEIYFRLFGRVADATEALEHGKNDDALRILIDAQKETEEAYLSLTE